MKYVRIPGFYPINWWVWNRNDHGRPWSPEECNGPLWRQRLRMLRSHRKFLRW